MASKLPEHVKRVRQDLSDRLWHFTRRDGSPKAALDGILKSGKVQGGTDRFCSIPSVCFTEMPLLEAIRQSPKLDEFSYNRMSDYGVGFTKNWIFSNGGRPVIYGTDVEKGMLPAELAWRHCVLDYTNGIDFTWQREWRVPGSELMFDDTVDVLVVVPTEDEAMELLLTDYCEDPIRDEVYFTIAWAYVTHERLRTARNSQDVEVLRSE